MRVPLLAGLVLSKSNRKAVLLVDLLAGRLVNICRPSIRLAARFASASASGIVGVGVLFDWYLGGAIIASRSIGRKAHSLIGASSVSSVAGSDGDNRPRKSIRVINRGNFVPRSRPTTSSALPRAQRGLPTLFAGVTGVNIDGRISDNRHLFWLVQLVPGTGFDLAFLQQKREYAAAEP